MIFLFRSETEVNTPRAMTSRSILENHNSTWFSHDEQVGVKCTVHDPRISFAAAKT
jgi:hypothetical protein